MARFLRVDREFIDDDDPGPNWGDALYNGRTCVIRDAKCVLCLPVGDDSHKVILLTGSYPEPIENLRVYFYSLLTQSDISLNVYFVTKRTPRVILEALFDPVPNDMIIERFCVQLYKNFYSYIEFEIYRTNKIYLHALDDWSVCYTRDAFEKVHDNARKWTNTQRCVVIYGKPRDEPFNIRTARLPSAKKWQKSPECEWDRSSLGGFDVRIRLNIDSADKLVYSTEKCMEIAATAGINYQRHLISEPNGDFSSSWTNSGLVSVLSPNYNFSWYTNQAICVDTCFSLFGLRLPDYIILWILQNDVVFAIQPESRVINTIRSVRESCARVLANRNRRQTRSKKTA
jgi:hypothetical protein